MEQQEQLYIYIIEPLLARQNLSIGTEEKKLRLEAQCERNKKNKWSATKPHIAGV